MTQPPIQERQSGAGLLRPVGNRPDRRGWIGKTLQYVLGPLYYWLDLYVEGSRRPSHTKLVAMVVLMFSVAITIWVAEYTFRVHGSLVTLFGFVTLMIFASYGLRGLRLWKESSAAEMMNRAAAVEPERLKAQAVLEQTRAAIAERRASTGGDYEPS